MFEIRQIHFSYVDQPVIRHLSFNVARGEHVALMGESGCGKSTLLKLLYGLHDLDEGQILFEGTKVLGPKFNLIPGHDQMKYLAQDFGLMPYATVAENVGHFLSNIDRGKKNDRIAELLSLVGMTDFAQIKPFKLSGGQQQRVALARILALEPKAVLLDEPFSQVDVFRANELRRNIFGYFKDNNITCITATHDSADVLPFADRILVLKDGELIANHTPKALYQNPTDRYAASLFGDVNQIPGSYLGKDADVLVYPHQLSVVEQSALRVTVLRSYFSGADYLVEAVYQHGKIYFRHHARLQKDRMVNLQVEASVLK